VVRTPFCAVAVHSCILHITGGLRMSGDQPASGDNTILRSSSTQLHPPHNRWVEDEW
jgi:hypothetical protein